MCGFYERRITVSIVILLPKDFVLLTVRFTDQNMNN